VPHQSGRLFLIYAPGEVNAGFILTGTEIHVLERFPYAETTGITGSVTTDLRAVIPGLILKGGVKIIQTLSSSELSASRYFRHQSTSQASYGFKSRQEKTMTKSQPAGDTIAAK
jgi:hypothetical protein